jgi:hypothetical protein
LPPSATAAARTLHLLHLLLQLQNLVLQRDPFLALDHRLRKRRQRPKRQYGNEQRRFLQHPAP